MRVDVARMRRRLRIVRPSNAEADRTVGSDHPAPRLEEPASARVAAFQFLPCYTSSSPSLV